MPGPILVQVWRWGEGGVTVTPAPATPGPEVTAMPALPPGVMVIPSEEMAAHPPPPELVVDPRYQEQCEPTPNGYRCKWK